MRKDTLGLVVLIATLALCAPVSFSAEPVKAISKPSEDVKLPFVLPGRVAKVLVKEGDKVEPNQVLMVQDDQAEQITLEQLRAQSEDTTKVRYADAQLEQKQVYLKRLEQVGKTASTETEIELARLDVKIAELQKELAEFEHNQDVLKYKEMAAQVERMKLKSPLTGLVEQVALQAGEGVDRSTPVIRLVKIDPLWIDVPVPLSQTMAIGVGGSARIEFMQVGGPAAEGKIIHIAAVADAASDTLIVRLEVPNPAGRPAGEPVWVSFLTSDKKSATASSQPTSSPAIMPVKP